MARSKMPKAREDDEIEHVPIPLKIVSPDIPKKESELKGVNRGSYLDGL